ncbi:F-box/FBD/LRR-repeat protein At1g13570-like [Rutidosis leptorrhynchoides]|uniref:F-box/FBD/LRR-repeat protein At1g13570-like n=1 Tax=Rutidosis leptorrhynchoides TaxID=125765 RepID=UPI003A98DBFB
MSQQEFSAMKIQRLPLDRLSTLAPNIIETILCLIPFRDAARTSVLSKEWRYNWTKIPKLEFDEDTFQVAADEKSLFNAVYQVLLQHQGPIVEFSLSMVESDTCVEVDHIIHCLSRMNTVKKLCLGYLCRIPLDVFSLHQLTDLHLDECHVQPQLTFDGFSSITTLEIDHIEIFKSTLVHLLSKCPLLKTLSLLQAHDLICSDDKSGLIELFECLPVIENLTIDLFGIRCFCEGEHPRKLPTSLYKLKYICLDDVLLCGHSYFGMPFLALLFRASPNVEKIKLSTYAYEESDVGEDYEDEESDVDEDYEDKELDIGEHYSDVQLKTLNELEIENLGTQKPELEFVKFMLVKSPVLKTLRISLNYKVAEDKELEMLNILLSCPHASPVVEITLHRDFRMQATWRDAIGLV